MKNTILHIAVLTAIGLAACSTTNSGFRKPDLSKVAIGMTKNEVISALGRPDDIATDGASEYFEYGYDSPIDGQIGRAETYFVRLMNERVDSYGRKGDFGTTANPAVDINVKQQLESRSSATTEKRGEDLYVKLKKLQQLRDEGLISETEIQKLKASAIEKAK